MMSTSRYDCTVSADINCSLTTDKSAATMIDNATSLLHRRQYEQVRHLLLQSFVAQRQNELSLSFGRLGADG